ncbi:hypothetical protein [Nocardia brasiliensis]|uniref:hypothetical protein n=1 Tax=Nocardia brasiliensis TaxID=37326 RepID=UPI003D933EA0
MASAGAVEGEFADELFAVEDQDVVVADEGGDFAAGVFGADGDGGACDVDQSAVGDGGVAG